MQTAPPTNEPMRVVLIDGDETLRLGLAQTLEQNFGYRIVGQGVTGLEMVELVQKHDPDIVVFDIQLSQLNGLDALRRLIQEKPVAAVAMTAEHNMEQLKRACQESVFAYLIKPVSAAVLGPMLEVAKARFEEIKQLRADNTKLEKTIENRKLIERAKGVLMRRHHWTEADAFRRLQRAAMNRRTTMADLARQILDGKEVDL